MDDEHQLKQEPSNEKDPDAVAVFDEFDYVVKNGSSYWGSLPRIQFTVSLQPTIPIDYNE